MYRQTCYNNKHEHDHVILMCFAQNAKSENECVERQVFPSIFACVISVVCFTYINTDTVTYLF